MAFAGLTNIGVAPAVASPRASTRQASPALGRQLAELAGTGSAALDWFGASVAVSGNTIVVGAPAEPRLSAGVGRAYVFTKTATGWDQNAELRSPDPLGPDWFGDSVAILGHTIVVGAPAISVLSSGLGRAYVFTKTATGWHESAQLEGPGTTVGDWFGAAVAVSARTVVVGAPGHNAKAGAAYVFTDFGQSWRAMQLKGSGYSRRRTISAVQSPSPATPSWSALSAMHPRPAERMCSQRAPRGGARQPNCLGSDALRRRRLRRFGRRRSRFSPWEQDLPLQTQAGCTCSPGRPQAGTKLPNWPAPTRSPRRMISAIRSPSRATVSSWAPSLKAPAQAWRTCLRQRPRAGAKLRSWRRAPVRPGATNSVIQWGFPATRLPRIAPRGKIRAPAGKAYLFEV